MKDLLSAAGVLVWVAGVVLAHGFWSTVLAICLPFWGWYLVVERALHLVGFI